MEKDTNFVDEGRCGKIFAMVEVGFCPPIGLIGTDNINVENLFTHLSVVSSSYIYGDIRNCLVVKRKGRHLVCLVHVEHRGEMGWRPRRLKSDM